MPSKRRITDKGTAKLAPHKLKFIRTPAFVSVYANNAQVRMTSFDLNCVFGEVTGDDPDGSLIVEQRVSVTMSPQHAKALVGVLQQHMTQYEEQFGEIGCQPEEKPPEKNAAT
jgi:hypothetical protein